MIISHQLVHNTFNYGNESVISLSEGLGLTLEGESCGRSKRGMQSDYHSGVKEFHK